jgi:hypothetical protein
VSRKQCRDLVLSTFVSERLQTREVIRESPIGVRHQRRASPKNGVAGEDGLSRHKTHTVRRVTGRRQDPHIGSIDLENSIVTQGSHITRAFVKTSGVPGM